MFISVKFNPQDDRAYTYTYAGDQTIVPGSLVVVETRDGKKVVKVHEVDLPEPPFRCKPISEILIEKEV